MSFKKRKLSREAIDAFAATYTEQQYPNAKDKVSYTKKDGESINFIPSAGLAHGSKEYYYLLGQAAPYHDEHHATFPVTDLVYLKTKDGKKEPWTRNASDLSALITLGALCRFILLEKRS